MSTTLTPLQEAEQARQVVNVLARIEMRITDGRWTRGSRVGPDGRNCLIGAVDEASRWVLPGVAEQVTRELVARLPRTLRAVGRVRPRLALATYNDTVGGRDGALELVRRTRQELGGLPLIRFAGEDRPQPWVAQREPETAVPAPLPTEHAGASSERADASSERADASSGLAGAGSEEPTLIVDLTSTWVARRPLRR